MPALAGLGALGDVAVRVIADKGKGVVALRHFRPGDVVFEDYPLVAGPLSQDATVCVSCLCDLERPPKLLTRISANDDDGGGGGGGGGDGGSGDERGAGGAGAGGDVDLCGCGGVRWCSPVCAAAAPAVVHRRHLCEAYTFTNESTSDAHARHAVLRELRDIGSDVWMTMQILASLLVPAAATPGPRTSTGGGTGGKGGAKDDNGDAENKTSGAALAASLLAADVYAEWAGKFGNMQPVERAAFAQQQRPARVLILARSVLRDSLNRKIKWSSIAHKAAARRAGAAGKERAVEAALSLYRRALAPQARGNASLRMFLNAANLDTVMPVEILPMCCMPGFLFL